MASIVAQALTLILVSHVVTLHYTSYIGLSIAVVLTSLLEAFTTQIDNLILPVFMYVVLISLSWQQPSHFNEYKYDQSYEMNHIYMF